MDPTTQALIAALRNQPDDATVYGRLKAHYLARGDVASAANLVEGWAARREDRLEASLAYVEAAQLVATSPDEGERFVSLLELALTLHPAHVHAHELLERHFIARGDVDGFIESLTRRRDNLARSAGEPTAIAELEFTLGDAWARHRRRNDRATLHYRAAYELDPTHVSALYAARQIYLEAGNVKAATRLLELEAKAERDPARKLALYRELQLRRARELGDFGGAIEAARTALSLAPGDASLKRDLATYLVERARGSTDAEAVTRDRASAAALFFELARIADDDEAITLGSNAVELDPKGPHASERRRWLAEAYERAERLEDAIRCLTPLVHGGDELAARKVVELSDARPEIETPMRVPALEVLAKLYERESRFDAAAIVLERLFHAIEDPELQIPVADRLAKLAIDVGDRPRALRILHAWVGLDPTDLEPLRRLVPLLLEEGPSEDLLDMLETLALDPQDGASYQTLAREIARKLGKESANVPEEELVEEVEEEVVDALEESAEDDVEEAGNELEDAFEDVEETSEALEDADDVLEDMGELVEEADALLRLDEEAEEEVVDALELLDPGELLEELEGVEELVENDAFELIDEGAVELIDDGR